MTIMNINEMENAALQLKSLLAVLTYYCRRIMTATTAAF